MTKGSLGVQTTHLWNRGQPEEAAGRGVAFELSLCLSTKSGMNKSAVTD